MIAKLIRIAAIDDHPAFCAGIGHIFQFDPGVEVMCLAQSFNAAGLGRMAVELGVFDDPVTQSGQP